MSAKAEKRARAEQAAREEADRQRVKDTVACARLCGSCAFNDVTAWEDDPDLGDKIAECLETEKRFVCHDGFPHNARGEFIPTKEAQLAAPLCAGFAAVKARLVAKGEAPSKVAVVRSALELCKERPAPVILYCAPMIPEEEPRTFGPGDVCDHGLGHLDECRLCDAVSEATKDCVGSA